VHRIRKLASQFFSALGEARESSEEKGIGIGSVALPILEIIAIEVLGGVAKLRTPNLGEDKAIGGWRW